VFLSAPVDLGRSDKYSDYPCSLCQLPPRCKTKNQPEKAGFTIGSGCTTSTSTLRSLRSSGPVGPHLYRSTKVLTLSILPIVTYPHLSLLCLAVLRRFSKSRTWPCPMPNTSTQPYLHLCIVQSQDGMSQFSTSQTTYSCQKCVQLYGFIFTGASIRRNYRLRFHNLIFCPVFRLPLSANE
jgi:hypothetical protein